jgi:hypothetical protein
MVLHRNIDLLGHPLVCHNDGGCKNILRIIRAASTHYPILRKFLRMIYAAIDDDRVINAIDRALEAGNFQRLLWACKIDSCDSLLANDIEQTAVINANGLKNVGLRDPNIEVIMHLEHAHSIELYEKHLSDYAVHQCVSCKCLYRRSNVTEVKLTDKIGNTAWKLLKQYIKERSQPKDVLYMCNLCKGKLRNNLMPPRCVLNGLLTLEVPPELTNLDALSLQLIQLAKSYQTVVRLGTYTGKVPAHSSLKACRGTMLFLTLLFDRTLGTLNRVQPSLCSCT